MRYLITASLLNSFKYLLESEYSTMDDFLATLRREKSPSTQEQLNGIRFENLVYAYTQGEYISPDEEWLPGIEPIGDECKDGAYQVKLFREIGVQGNDYLVYGILDFLKNGTIIDVKTTKRYAPERTAGKFYNSPQTAAYFFLVPEAKAFRYLIYDFGDYVYEEKYYPDETKHIGRWIDEFYRFLERAGLTQLYKDNWRCKDD